MAITDFQRQVCRLIAQSRVDRGEAYVAGGVALNTLLEAPRISRDIDLFHDTHAALTATWADDRRLLLEEGYAIDVERERPAFVEAVVRKEGQSIAMQWVCDSAFRFFPLLEHPDFGLTLHPFDLATNKVLALVGRLEVRDWIDVLECNDRLQHLGCLAWAACGKDPGYNPAMIVAEARRSGRYSEAEVAELAFEGTHPAAADLSRRWATILREAEQIFDVLPPGEIGRCLLEAEGGLLQGSVEQVARALSAGKVVFHSGTIRGAFPSIAAPSSRRDPP